MDFPTWFIIGIGWFIFSVVMGIIGHLLIVKSSQKLIELPTETKARLIKRAAVQIKLFKFYFWMLPLNLILIPVLIYIYAPTEYLLHVIIILILSYAGILHAYWNKKYYIRLLENDKKELIN